MGNKKGNQEQRNKSMCSFKYISNVITNISIICSFMGISLFGGFFYGLEDILDYKNICLTYECAHYLTIAAVIFFFLGAILSQFSKQDSEQAKSVPSQISLRGRASVDKRRDGNISSDFSKKTTKELKSPKSDKKTKQDTVTESTKPSKTSPKNLQFAGIFKRDKITAKSSSLPISSKNLTPVGKSKRDDVGAKSFSLQTSSKIIQDTVTSKQANISTKTLSPNPSFKTLKPGATPQKSEINSRASSKNILSTIQQTKTKEVVPKTSQLFNGKCDKQLVPYKARLDCNVPVAQKVPLFQDSMSMQACTRYSTSNLSSNGLKLDARHQQKEFSPGTSSKKNPAALQPIGPPKPRNTGPGTFSPRTTQNSSEKVTYTDTGVFPLDPWVFAPKSEDNIPIRPNIPFHQNFVPAYTPGTENFPSIDSQLFPYNPQLFGSPVSEQNIPEGPKVPFYRRCIPPYASHPAAAEILATKTVTFFEGGIAQSREQYHHTMLFPSLGNGIWSPNFNYPSDQSVGMLPLTSRESDQNKVSDIQTKFESMNMY